MRYRQWTSEAAIGSELLAAYTRGGIDGVGGGGDGGDYAGVSTPLYHQWQVNVDDGRQEMPTGAGTTSSSLVLEDQLASAAAAAAQAPSGDASTLAFPPQTTLAPDMFNWNATTTSPTSSAMLGANQSWLLNSLADATAGVAAAAAGADDQGYVYPDPRDPVTSTYPDPFLPMHVQEGWNDSWQYLNWSFGGNYSYDLVHGNPGNDTDYLPLTAAVLRGLALAIVVLMTITGNVLVLLAVFVNAHLRSTTHYFIANLAVADLLLGSTVLPFSASLEVVNYWAFGQTFCEVWAALDVLCCTASILSLCVISIDRYIGVTRPLQHSSIMTEKRAGLIILCVWLLSATISVAPLLGWKEPAPDDPTICEVTTQLGYVLFSVSGSFYIPLAIILVVYFRVYREALIQSKFLKTGVKTSKDDETSQEVTLRIHTGGRPPSSTPGAFKPALLQSSSSSERSEESGRKQHHKLTLAGKIAKFNREKKAAKTLGIVVGVFILCWFPFFFLLPLEALCKSCRSPEWLFKVIFWLGYCNSMMNPIIYACSSREFKRAFIRILRCQWRRRPRTFLEAPSVSTCGGGPSSSARAVLEGSCRMAELGNSICSWSQRTSSRDCSTNHHHHGGADDGGIDASTPTTHFQGRERGKLFSEERPSHVFSAQATSIRGRLDDESPISSLKQLHNHHRTEVMAAISDDESGMHEASDLDGEDDSGSGLDMEDRAVNDCLLRSEGEDEDEDELRTSLLRPADKRLELAGTTTTTPLLARTFNGKSCMNRYGQPHYRVPEIVIDDISNDIPRRSSTEPDTPRSHARSHPRDVIKGPADLIHQHIDSTSANLLEMQTYHAAQDDNIMWL